MDGKIAEAQAQVNAAQEAAVAAKTEAQQKLVGMIPSTELEKAQNALLDEQRKARDLQSQIQRSEDGFKALRTAEGKMIELQNDLSRSREELARLKSASTSIIPTASDADYNRLKETLRTAETLAGNERRRADELAKEKAASVETNEKIQEELKALKALKLDPDAKAKLETDLATCAAARKSLESDLQIEKQRVTALDREYHIFKTQLAQCRSESEKIKAELSAANDKIASLETAPREELMPALEETSPAVEIPIISSLAAAEAPAVVEEPAATKPQKNTLATEVLGKRVVQDDLKIVEGIGPKIEELLNADGISTWQQLGESSVERIQDILSRAGERFVMHNPTTWPRQGQLAHEAKWDELRAWQDQLDGGKLPE